MKRRQFLTTGAATGAAVAAATVSAPAISQGMKELKLVTSFPKNFPGLGTSAARVAKRITAATNGRVQVRLFDAGELVPAFGVFDAVSEGNAEMYFSAEYYFPSKSQAFNFFTAVPFGMTHLETWAWLMYGGGYELWRDLHDQFGMVPFPAPATGVQMGGWLNKQITKLDDYKGVKFRMPGLGGEVLRALGVAVVNLPGGEIFPALQSGAIDGSEWVGPWHDLAFGFHRVVKHYHWPGFHEPGTAGSYAINKQFWEGLSAEDREIITAILEAEVFIQSAEYDGRSPTSLDTLVSKHGVMLHKFPDSLLVELGKVSSDVVGQVGATDANTQKVWDSYRAFRKTAIGWSKISLQGYMNARALPFAYG
jgi:TRAP-type mannitol/chloroaromatic compound transport system substrate-binding protein